MEVSFVVRLFFAFVPRSPREGKRRNFHARYEHLLVQSDGVLWVEVKRASIRVPVHGLGNLCKTFQAKKAGASAAAEAPREQPF
ncbi:MAG: hypothetical protein DMG56_04445 [Acidobacteria bacterium]|nr:MAG: hypothetical protein DMG53_22280 [Acidobacteriota bacterium]PYU44053.1 MAG: hypothetical protein DMG54_10545 [Acidobacteriota bacterium]PYU65104.1 MAG: hypothetical protein DMG56_04445 [Acidobacteriota bacterium]PYU77174.1 MAG: hypothetical protein DMG52_01680 [Acidobacteriota bacterium]